MLPGFTDYVTEYGYAGLRFMVHLYNLSSTAAIAQMSKSYIESYFYDL